MHAFFDWLDTPGLLGDVLMCAGFMAVFVAASLAARKQQRQRTDRRDAIQREPTITSATVIPFSPVVSKTSDDIWLIVGPSVDANGREIRQ